MFVRAACKSFTQAQAGEQGLDAAHPLHPHGHPLHNQDHLDRPSPQHQEQQPQPQQRPPPPPQGDTDSRQTCLPSVRVHPRVAALFNVARLLNIKCTQMPGPLSDAARATVGIHMSQLLPHLLDMVVRQLAWVGTCHAEDTTPACPDSKRCHPPLCSPATATATLTAASLYICSLPNLADRSSVCELHSLRVLELHLLTATVLLHNEVMRRAGGVGVGSAQGREEWCGAIMRYDTHGHFYSVSLTDLIALSACGCCGHGVGCMPVHGIHRMLRTPAIQASVCVLRPSALDHLSTTPAATNTQPVAIPSSHTRLCCLLPTTDNAHGSGANQH